MNFHQQRLVVAGCARDCAPHLGKVFANLRTLTSHFESSAMVWAHNDSQDDTRAALEGFCRQQAHAQLLHLDGLQVQAPQRTVRLAIARNALLATLRQWPQVQDHHWLVMVDMDDVNAQPWPMEPMLAAMQRMQERPDVVGIFPNQLGLYYDMWALREAQRCPGDVWAETFQIAMQSKCSDEAAFEQGMKRRLFELPTDAAPMAVDSAFGGFGIYRLSAVLNNLAPYCGETVQAWGPSHAPQLARWQTCEHVSFHLGLRQQGGRLFVMPGMVNTDTTGLSFPAQAFRSMLF
jgi:hypothetical protein